MTNKNNYNLIKILGHVQNYELAYFDLQCNKDKIKIYFLWLSQKNAILTS